MSKRCASSLPAYLVAALVAALVAVPVSHAKEPPRNYITLKLGGFLPLSDDLDDIDADAGVQGEIALGHYVAPGFAIEGGLGYFETEGTRFGVDRKLEVTPLTVSLRGQVPYGAFEPYGFIGVGAYFVDDTVSGAIPQLGIGGPSSEDDTALGYHVGFGGSYTLPNGVFVGLEARYLWVESDTFEDIRIGGVSLTANAGYRF